MADFENNQGKSGQTKNRGCLRTLGIILITSIISIIGSVVVLNYYLFPQKLEPVE
jgi:hypothetical protein